MIPLPSFQQLRFLCALAERCHFGKAAESCAVTQSTLSGGIKELEERLLSGAVPDGARQALTLRPATVAVHDDGDVTRHARHVGRHKPSSGALEVRRQAAQGCRREVAFSGRWIKPLKLHDWKCSAGPEQDSRRRNGCRVKDSFHGAK